MEINLDRILNLDTNRKYYNYIFVEIIRGNSFLKDNAFLLSIFKKLEKKNSTKLSDRQLDCIKVFVEQWKDDAVQFYFKLCNKYPFLKTLDLYKLLISGKTLSQNQKMWLYTSLEEYEEQKNIYKYLKQDNRLNFYLYRCFIENILLSSDELKEALDLIKNEKLLNQFKEHQAVLQTFIKSKIDTLTQKTLQALIKKQQPITHRKFITIKKLTKNVKASDMKINTVKYNNKRVPNKPKIRQI